MLNHLEILEGMVARSKRGKKRKLKYIKVGGNLKMLR